MEEVILKTSMPTHPKLLAVGPFGGWLQVCGLCYAGKHNTGGFIPESALPLISNIPLEQLEEVVWSLIAAGMWVEEDGGYRIHEFGEYQYQNELTTQDKRDFISAFRDVSVLMKKRVNSSSAPADLPAHTRAHDDARRSGRVKTGFKERNVNSLSDVNEINNSKTVDDVDDDINNSSRQRPVTPHTHASASARGTIPPNLVSKFEMLIGPEAMARFATRYLQLDPNLDEVWLSKNLVQCANTYPDLAKGDVLNAISKAITQTRVATVKSSVTAYAASVLLDRVANESALAAKRESHAKSRGRNAGIGPDAIGEGRTDPGDGELGLAARERLLREQIT